MSVWRNASCSDSVSDESEEVDLDTFKLSAKLRRRVNFFSKSSSDTDVSDDLPDGFCYTRPGHGLSARFMNKSLQMSDGSGRACDYIGSFPVLDNESSSKTEVVQNQLDSLRNAPAKKSVFLLVTLTGVKVCSPDSKVVYMAHALRRISWATCSPGQFQFSFLAREPKHQSTQRYCHVFRTHTPRQAEELSSLVGSAFRMAYAKQIQQQQHNRSQSPIVLSSLTPPSSPVVADASAENRSPEASPPSALGKVWAKKIAGRTKHRDPVVDGFLELNARMHPTSSPINNIANNVMVGTRRKENNLLNAASSSSSSSPMSSPSSPVNGPAQQPSSPFILPLQRTYGACANTSKNLCNDAADPWSPSSNEDNNSPTEFNCCKKFVDKPPLVKTLEESWQTTANNRNIVGSPTSSLASSADASRSKFVSTENVWERENSNVGSPKKTPNVPADQQQKMAAGTTMMVVIEKKSSSTNEEESCSEVPNDSPSGSKRCSQSSSEQSGSSLHESSISDNNHSSRAAVGCTYFVPPPPERYDSLTANLNEEKELRGAPWFQAGIPREIALEVLAQEPVGSFMVRKSTTKPGCYALSLRVPRDFQPSGIAHYLIMHTNKGYKIKGFTKEFSTLTSLITHHSVMPELLPCPLSLSRYNSTFRKNGSVEDLVDIDEDPDYNLLADFRKMMADVV